MTDRRILCFGEVLWDVWPDRRVAGGAPANVAVGLARLGAKVRLLSRVGADADGAELVTWLRANGLSTDDVGVDPDVATGRVLVDVSDPREVRYEICSPAAWDHIPVSAEPDGSPDVLVYGSLAARHATSRAALHGLLDRARLRVFDVNLRPPFVEEAVVDPLLERADWVKVNEAELAALCAWSGVDVGPGVPGRALRELADRHGLEAVCVTRGDRGAAMWMDGRLFEHPGFDVDVVDTIGCGDAFLAAWMRGLLAGRPPQEALARACALGALVATRPGATPRVGEAAIEALLGGPG